MRQAGALPRGDLHARGARCEALAWTVGAAERELRSGETPTADRDEDAGWPDTDGVDSPAQVLVTDDKFATRVATAGRRRQPEERDCRPIDADECRRVGRD
jgi:hypothetical protein